MLLNRMMSGYSPVAQLEGEMSKLFESFFEDLPAVRSYAAGYPAMNTWEDGGAAYVEAELPGMNMDDVEIFVRGSDVTISGERKMAEPENASWHRRERSQGKFTRSLSLPWEIDADRVEATLRDGVLSVKLPKCESCKPKKIEVRAS